MEDGAKRAQELEGKVEVGTFLSRDNKRLCNKDSHLNAVPLLPYLSPLMTQALQRELHAVQKREAESAALSSERDMLQSRVRRLEEAEEVLQSELATAQSDLATMSSQANTHRMATERVGHITGTLPFLMYHTMSHCVFLCLHCVKFCV